MENKKEKCMFLPTQECSLNDIGTGCLNWCRKREMTTYPIFVSNQDGDREFNSAEEYEKWLLACKHNQGTWTDRGCDGIVAWTKKVCNKCGFIITDERQEVWRDACV